MDNNTDLIEKMCPTIDFTKIPTHLVNAIPKHKMDVSAALEAKNLGHPSIEPILPILVTWLQDFNWPVAQEIEPYLKTLGTKLTPVVKEVLKTEDDVWKYWVLICLVDVADLELARSIEPELQGLLNSKSPEGLADIAKDILAKLNPQNKPTNKNRGNGPTI